MANNGGKVNVQIGFSVDKSGLSELQASLQNIAYRAKEPGNELKTGLQQAAKTASTLDNILSKTFNTDLGSLNVTKFNQELAKSGLTLKDVKNDLTLAGNYGVNAFNRLSQAVLGTNQQIKQSSKLLDEMFTTFKNTVRYGISSSIFNTMANSIEKAYSYSKQLNTSLNDIRIVTDKSAESMAEFAKQANEASKGMGASTLDYSNAALIYYQQGLSDAEVQARAETTIKAANVTGQTGEVVSEQLTAVWNGYKVSAAETELYVDKLAAVAATTAADLEELSVGMSKVASAANAMGVDFDDLNAQIATIVSVTRQAPESVGTALKTIYARLGDLKIDGVDEFGVSLGEVSEQMTQIGVQILDQEGNMRDMSSVIAEVAQKWTGWTEAQRQAVAVAMAGKRQYNNLIALFDNWDMYTNALNTSTEAMGTLQHQQDIYMESTAAKLKTLKAAWQGLYDDAINEDEINDGIEALTNLVEVFDNFIKSFGGGIKSIAGFGAIVSSVFNKQIAEGIVNTTQRLNVFKQNLELAKTTNDFRQMQSAEAGDDARSVAIEANTKQQVEYSQKIYESRVGLNQEQANTLINYQREIGALEEQIVYLQEITERAELEHLTDLEISDILTADSEKLEKIAVEYGKIEDEAQTYLNSMKAARATLNKDLDTVKKLSTLQKHVKDSVTDLSTAEKQAFNQLVNQQGTREQLIQLIEEQVQKAQQNLDSIKEEEFAADRVVEARKQIAELTEKQNNVKMQADDMLDAANNATTLTQKITTVTSALGNMAMAWSSISSLIDTWNDESASFGDKITQSLMVLGMTIPMIISNFSKLNDVLSVGRARNAALMTVEAKAQAALTGEESKEIVVTTIKNIAEAEEIKLTEKETLSLAALVMARKADTVETNKETVAQIALNAARNADPIVKIIAILTTLIAVIALVVKWQKKQLENQIELNNKEIERVNAIQEEVDKNEELYNSYEKLYNQYKKHQVEKEDLFDVTNKLAEKYDIENAHILELTGNYDALTKSIKKARDAELDNAITNTRSELNAAESNVLDIGRQTKQGYKSGNRYHLNFKTGGEIADEDKARAALAANAEEFFNTTLANGNTYAQFYTDIDMNDPKQMVELYDAVAASVAQMDEDMSIVERQNSEVYQDALSWIEKMKDPVEEYRTALEQLQNYQVQKKANQIGLLDANSLDDFTHKIKKFKEELKDVDLGDNSIDDVVSNYLAGLDSDYANIALGLEELKSQVDEEAQKYIDNLSEGEKEYLISGKVDLSFVQTKEDIEKAIQISFNNLGTFDVEAPINFQSTLASGNKLKKADKTELQALESESPEAMAGFDDKSLLHQMDVIDEVTQYRIQKNNEFLTNYEEVIKQEIELREQELKALYSSDQEFAQARVEYKEISKALEDKTYKDEEEKKALEEKQKVLAKNIEDYETLRYLINDLNNDLEAGLTWDQIEDVGFSSLIADLESVANRATAVQNAMGLIGDSFKVAASDVAKFSNTFPELLENAQALSDGSLQLDKDVVKQNIEGVKAEMEARTQAKIAEVDQQIALKELEKEYLEEKLNNLEAYLKGEQTQSQTIAKIKLAGQQYESGLMEITGQEVKALTDFSIEEANNEGEALISMLNQVGAGFAQAAQAHYAMISGQEFSWNDLNFGGTAATAQQYASNAGKDATAAYERASETYTQIFEQAKQTQEQLNIVTGELDQLNAQRAILESSGNAAIHSLDNVASGKAGKDSKSNSGKDKDKDKKKYEEEFDRYWEINKALDAIDRSLKKLDKDQENLYGKELIRSLKQENELLDQQAGLYNQLAEAQQAEAAELRNTLSGYGVAFDASGAITNYAAATVEALKQYNDAIAKYNAGLLTESALKVYEKNYEAFKKALERYDTLYYKEMQETQEKLDDIRRKQLANNLKAWEVEVQLKLDWKELERDWNDFLHEVSEDFKKVFKDLRVELKNMYKDASTYIGADGTIGSIIDAIHDVTNEIDKMMGGGSSEMFESVSQAQEKLKELNSQLQDAGKALHELWTEAWQNYLDGIDQVADSFNDLMDRFERITDELEFQGKLIELLYGDKAYELMSNLYEGQEKNTRAQLESLKQQADMWKDLFDKSGATMDNQANWTEDQKKYYEQWIEAQGKLNDMIVSYIELLQKDYLNTIKNTLKQLEKFITGSSLDDIATQWERIKANADKYYDSVEKAYQIQTLGNKIKDTISSTTSLKNQQKLQELYDKEMKYLREKEKLTEYDIQAAEARYQIALKEIALEEAQQNKTSMKLTRNEQGNWSYQYVADEDDVATKRQDLLDAYNNLYELASNAYEKNLESLQELQEKYLESLQKIAEDTTMSEEEKNNKLKELDEWYFEQYRLLSDENALYREDLVKAGAMVILEVYEQDEAAYEAMTEAEKRLLDELKEKHIETFSDMENNYESLSEKAIEVMATIREDWTSSAQQIAEVWNADNGESVRSQVTAAYEAIEAANQKYKEAVDWCAEAVGRNFGEEGIKGAIDAAGNATDALANKTAELVDKSVPYLNQLKKYVDMIGDAWKSVQQQIRDAISLIEEYLRKVGEANSAGSGSGGTGGGGGNSGGGTGGTGGKNPGGGTPKKASNDGYSIQDDPYGVPGNKGIMKDGRYVYIARDEVFDANAWARSHGYDSFKTGGYTGSWSNDSGKLAMLHQKELVLNADDTKNFLSGINTIRSMVSSTGSIQDAIMKAVGNMALSLGGYNLGSGMIGNRTNNANNTYNITAEFPNANSVEEIREAILSLPNIASQYANSNLR